MMRILKSIVGIGTAIALIGCADDIPGSETSRLGCQTEDCGAISEGAESAAQGSQSCDGLLCGAAVVGVHFASLEDPDVGAALGPGAEIACDGLDQDGNGFDLCDTDEDGISDGLDCAPKDPKVSPHAIEIRCDGLDQNCDGVDDCDGDDDGVLNRRDCDLVDPVTTIACDNNPLEGYLE